MIRPPEISVDTSSPPFGVRLQADDRRRPGAHAVRYFPPSLRTTTDFLKLLPVTSIPLLRRFATAFFARSERYAAFVAGFLITLYVFAMVAVRLNSTGSMTPIPSLFGQMRAFTSFICQR